VSADSGGLLGRDAEVADAVEVLTGASGGAVAVVGDAGIGKSALVREVARRLSEAGLAVRTTAGAVSEVDLPFVGLHDLIGEDVAAGMDDLPVLLREALDATLLRARPDEGGTDPLALNLAVLRVLERLSADHRLVLVLDDLPWIDTGTRTVLSFALRRLPSDRVSVLVAMRPGWDGLEMLPQAGPRTVAVGPLDAETLAAAVERRTGVRLAHRFARHLHELSGGNPLLALEVARTVNLDQDALVERAVPERYRAVLSPRLAALSADAARALLAASLLARPTLEELADVVTIAGILEAEAAGVVRVEAGRIAFTHPLFAALCRDGAPRAERRDMHALLAKAARDEVERAHHLGSATLLPDADVATQIEDAAERARARAAIAAGAELSLLAERLTPVDDLERRTARACLAAELFQQTGDIDTAAGVVRRVLDGLEPGPVRARCLILLAQVTGEDSEGAAALFQEALRQPGLEPDLQDELRFASAAILVNLGDLVASRAGVPELEERAEAAGRADLARMCRAHLAFLDLLTGTPPARSQVWQRVVDEASDYELSYDHPDLMKAWAAMSEEQNERALGLVTGLMERARLTGNIGLWGALAMHANEVELRRGNIAHARELIDQAYRTIADGLHDEGLLCFRALTLAWQGRLEDAGADAAQAAALARRHRNRLFEVAAYHALGFVALSAGRSGDAARYYEMVVAGLRAMGWRHPSLIVWQGNAVEVLVATGRRSAAISVVEDLETMAQRYELATSAALAARCRGLLLEDEGELEAAVLQLDESVRLSEPLGTPLEHARTLLIRGVVQRRRRQKALSRADLERARDLFARYGAEVWAARAERELRRSAAVAAGAELTASERAVAELAASGATNREIAASLYLSEKTVEAVLTRVYRKLGIRSRTQLGHHPELAEASEGPA
jgi:DNA-binding CsgD family transcriptional regulator